MESELHQQQLGLHARVATLTPALVLHFTHADNGFSAPPIPTAITEIAAKLLM